MRTFILLIFMLIISAPLSYSQYRLTDKDLAELDKEILKVPEYDKVKYANIDSLKKRYMASADSSDRLRIALKLGKEYESFISDSAFVYYEKALSYPSANDDIDLIRANIGLAKVLGVSGLFKESVDELEKIEKRGIPDALKKDYYDCSRQVYSYMMDYAQGNSKFSTLYFKKNRMYRDSLCNMLSKDSPLYRFYNSEVLLDQGKNELARGELLELVRDLPVNDPIVARATSQIAKLYSMEHKEDAAAHFLVRSAISDIKCSIKENTSLQNLALYLYDSGDVERAYKYIMISMGDANFCNARMRNMQIARNMTVINDAYKAGIEDQQNTLMGVLIVVSILSVGLIIAVVLILYQNKKLSMVRYSLRHANTLKEEYMGHFLELCSIYMERLDSFNKTVMRKVNTGQLDDLKKMTKSPKFAEEQNKLFYENFDSAFLHIYPTFVEDFNALLIPEERIKVKEIGKLTMELRIFAFLRMGIEDSNKIASFLHYSVNTIYTYRNKIKNKAIDRADFEKNIMKIGNPDGK